jgi:hypothetical protein
VLAKRYANWIAPLIVRDGKLTPDSGTVFALIFSALDGTDASINIDAIGIGAGVYDKTQEREIPITNAHTIVGSEKTEWQDKQKLFKMRNVRSAMYWKLREWLDPEGGPEETRLCLPPDAELAADLCAPRWRVLPGGTIQVEPKESETDSRNWGIKNRLGRSPDRGDSVALSSWTPDTCPATERCAWSTSTTSAPSARIIRARSGELPRDITATNVYPFTPQTMARPVPVLPLVSSTTVRPGRRRPSASASSMICRAIRSFLE